MKKRIFHLSFYIVIFLFIVIFMSIECFAGGTYYVDRDEGGVYFQTDNHGGWYIDSRELKHFKIGENGTYLIGKDRNGTFLRTDKKRKFYLDIEAKAKEVAVLKLKKQLAERWFVYILRCADGSLYTGIAKDVDRRLEQHNAGTASRYTRSRLPVTMEFQEELPNQSLALKRELAIKALSRQQKEALIRLDTPAR